MMQALAHEMRTAQPASRTPLRSQAPAPRRGRTAQPPAAHEASLVAGRRAALAETRCACGGIVGSEGECPACRARREAAEASARSDVGGAREAADGTEPVEDEHMTVLLQAANNGETTCNFPAGTPSSSVSNATCSRTCTTRHEAVHLTDITPCCAAAGTAHRAAVGAAAKTAVSDAFFTWMNNNRSWFECRAYATSVTCADGEIATKKCGTPDMAAADSACCTELTAYRADKESRRVSNCAAAAAALSACPYP